MTEIKHYLETTMEEITRLSSRIAYKNRWMVVREDRIQRPSGSNGVYGVVEKPDFAIILPVQDGYVYIVEQYRYPIRKRCWELPQGSWNGEEKLSHEEVAALELREETGLNAKILKYVGELFVAYGYSNQKCRIYFATGFSQMEPHLETEEEGLVSKKIRLLDRWGGRRGRG